MERQLKKNFLYNFFYQILVIILPIITVPYVSRIIGSEGIGIYSYTYSIVYYFMLFSMLGINNYGNRTIAKVKDKGINEISKQFWGIYCIQLIMTSMMLFCYIMYIKLFNSNYFEVAIIQTLYLVSTLFDVNWFFFGIEKFKLTVTRNTIVKVISLVFIFAFVKKSTDIVKYVLILALSTLISQIFLVIVLKKYIRFTKVGFSDIKKHIKPIIILFIPVLSYSIYKVMDKIMIGNMSDISEVGYYENAEKIINLPMGIVTALGSVMLPRISNLVANKEFEKINEYLVRSIDFIMFLVCPIMMGLVSVSDRFTTIFLGDAFKKTGYLINYLAVTILFISIANVIRTQYLIPHEKDKDYVYATFMGAVINLLFNMILIPRLQSIGACIGTILAEFIVMIYQVVVINRHLPILKIIWKGQRFLFASIIMAIFVNIIGRIQINNNIVVLFIQVISGICIYMLLTFKYFFKVIREK